LPLAPTAGTCRPQIGHDSPPFAAGAAGAAGLLTGGGPGGLEAGLGVVTAGGAGCGREAGGVDAGRGAGRGALTGGSGVIGSGDDRADGTVAAAVGASLR
jgi:hypothetical protein